MSDSYVVYTPTADYSHATDVQRRLLVTLDDGSVTMLTKRRNKRTIDIIRPKTPEQIRLCHFMCSSDF